MRVGERAKVTKLDRPTKEDRSARLDQEGLIVRRLNVPWTPEHGALWELRFDDGETVVFAEDELGGNMTELAESWGDAPRRPSLPFKRFGAGTGAAPAILALLVFALAGVLLMWVGVSEQNWAIGAAGVVLMLIGITAAGVLIS